MRLDLPSSLFRITVVACLLWPFITEVRAADRPNILWITAEDMSPTLGCYGDQFAKTPNVDKLATESTRYTNAFATAPVCSPSRACLINGCVATTQGTHNMRSLFPLPKAMNGFPSLLRSVGYFTSNNVKADYNSAAEDRIKSSSWDRCSADAHWRQRKPGQPFFAIFNLMTSHQSRTMVWPYQEFRDKIQSELTTEQIADPKQVPLPPYYPDTLLVRKTQARYYDCVSVMDAQVGVLLEQLKSDGLDENTIVFFYSDHGSGMPRHKRALFDSGMQVPLLIRFPKKYEDLAPTQAGQTTDRLVCFEDFGPTVLSLTGIQNLPNHMRGKPFLGALASPPREYCFGHRDRVDEIMDMARSVRSSRYLYIRNFMPHLGYNQQSAWIDQGKVRQDFYALAKSGNATPAQAQYLSGTRANEELYDCKADPLNLNNLANQEDMQAELNRMRRALETHMIESRDLGLIPEIQLWEQTDQTTPMAWSESSDWDVARILSAANLVGKGDLDRVTENLSDKDAAVRYWAALSCSVHPFDLPESTWNRLVQCLEDPSIAVQIEAANALVLHGETTEASNKLLSLIKHSNETIVLHAARAIELLGSPKHFSAMKKLAHVYEKKPGDIAWFVRFSTSGYLSRQNGHVEKE